MISLAETYQELLNEQSSQQMLLEQAIKNKWVVTIDYRGDPTVHAGKRDIEPVCLGVTKAGNLAIRAWQIKGVSDTPDNLPGWRLFLIRKITSVRTNKTPFTRPRPNFNPNGDRTLARVMLIARFR